MGRGAGCPVSPDDAYDITITLTWGDWAKDGPYHGLDRGRLNLNLLTTAINNNFWHKVRIPSREAALAP